MAPRRARYRWRRAIGLEHDVSAAAAVRHYLPGRDYTNVTIPTPSLSLTIARCALFLVCYYYFLVVLLLLVVFL